MERFWITVASIISVPIVLILLLGEVILVPIKYISDKIVDKINGIK